MADALRTELLSTGIKVGLVCPSYTESEFSDRLKRIGPPQGSKRFKKHSAESVADAIIKMARTGKREMILSSEGKLMNWINSLAPGIMDRILAKALMK